MPVVVDDNFKYTKLPLLPGIPFLKWRFKWAACGFVVPIPTRPSVNIVIHESLITALGELVSVFSRQKCNLLRDQLFIPSAIIAHFKPDVSLKPVPKYNIELPVSEAALIDALLL